LAAQLPEIAIEKARLTFLLLEFKDSFAKVGEFCFICELDSKMCDVEAKDARLIANIYSRVLVFRVRAFIVSDRGFAGSSVLEMGRCSAFGS